jgi:hypothetical protein
MSGRTFVQIQEQVFDPFAPPRLPTDYILVIYARQSQKDAPFKHKESYEQQTVRLIEYAKRLGWSEDRIIVLIENKRKDGRWRKASGTLRIDQREGLQTTVGLIETNECKAVMCIAIDRLFRHEDMIEPAIFVKICKDHDVIILTPDDFFDFNNPKRDDRRRFLELAQQAADYINNHIKKRMIPAMYQVARRGEYDGRCLPTGFYILEDEKKPRAFDGQIEVIVRLFKRYKNLDGRFNLLWREVAPIRDLFPPYPKEARGVKPYTKEGPFGITRDGLINILTNIAYIGEWYFKEKGKTAIRIPGIYPAVIDEDTFWFAFNNLSKTKITGEPNELRSIRPPARFDKVGTIPAQALLEGIVTCVVPGYHVYVLQNADDPGKAMYSIEGRGYETGNGSVNGYILVRELDPIFEDTLKYRLRIFQAVDELIGVTGSPKPSEKSIYEYLKAVQAMTNESLAGVSTQLAEYRQEISNIERVLKLNAHLETDESIIKMGERLSNLNITVKELEKKDEKRMEDEDLKEAANLILEASTSYEGMKFDKKQKLLRLVTTKLELQILAPRWLTLSVAWSPFLGTSLMDRAYIWHPYGAGGKWSDEEIEILKRVYGSQEKDRVLEELYNRSWAGIRHMASEKGIKRQRWLKDSTLPDILSKQDYDIMKYNELDYSDPKKRVWWKSVLDQENEACPGISILRREQEIITASRKISF